MKQYRILVVDDEPRIVKFLKLKLKASGYEVLTAGNGLEALEMVQAQVALLLGHSGTPLATSPGRSVRNGARPSGPSFSHSSTAGPISPSSPRGLMEAS